MFSNINNLRLLLSKVLYVENDRLTSTDVIGAYLRYRKSSVEGSSESPSSCLMFILLPNNMFEIFFKTLRPMFLLTTLLSLFKIAITIILEKF